MKIPESFNVSYNYLDSNMVDLIGTLSSTGDRVDSLGIPVDSFVNRPLFGYTVYGGVYRRDTDMVRLLDPRGFIVHIPIIDFMRIVDSSSFTGSLIDSPLVYFNGSSGLSLMVSNSSSNGVPKVDYTSTDFNVQYLRRYIKSGFEGCVSDLMGYEELTVVSVLTKLLSNRNGNIDLKDLTDGELLFCTVVYLYLRLNYLSDVRNDLLSNIDDVLSSGDFPEFRSDEFMKFLNDSLIEISHLNLNRLN